MGLRLGQDEVKDKVRVKFSQGPVKICSSLGQGQVKICSKLGQGRVKVRSRSGKVGSRSCKGHMKVRS